MRLADARQRGAVHFYIMELQKGMYIDAEHAGSKARFMNSSCEPNCETQKWVDAATGAHRCTVTLCVCVWACMAAHSRCICACVLFA